MKYQITAKTADADGVAFEVACEETVARKTYQHTLAFRIGRSAFEALPDPTARAAMVEREIQLLAAPWLAELAPAAQQQDWVPDDKSLKVGVMVQPKALA